MATQADSSQPSVLDSAKLVLALALLIAGVAGFYYFSTQSVLYRALSVIGSAALAITIIFTTKPGKSLWGFFRESRAEVGKMIWPTRPETMQTTMIVVALVFLVGLILWLLDMVLYWGVTLLTGQGS